MVFPRRLLRKYDSIISPSLPPHPPSLPPSLLTSWTNSSVKDVTESAFLVIGRASMMTFPISCTDWIMAAETWGEGGREGGREGGSLSEMPCTHP